MRLFWIFIIDKTPKSTFQVLESNTAKFVFSQFRNFGGSIGDLVVVLDLEDTNGIFRLAWSSISNLYTRIRCLKTDHQPPHLVLSPSAQRSEYFA